MRVKDRRDNCRCAIYAIKCTENGRLYIGKTTSAPTRFSTHFHLLRKGRHHNTDLQMDFFKYGDDKFEAEIIYIPEAKWKRFPISRSPYTWVPDEGLFRKAEIYFIRKYSTMCYNKKYKDIKLLEAA